MQPDPALIEKQKQETLYRRQRAEQMRVRNRGGYSLILEAQRRGVEKTGTDGGGRLVETDDGPSALKSLVYS